MRKIEKIISMPLHVVLGRKKYYFNLNQYRNWHYIVNNKLKQAYFDLSLPKVRGWSFKLVRIEFKLFKATKRKTDRANVLCIHEKFFCDALVKAGCLVDDNDNFIMSTHYSSGGIDRDNPRVEIKIIECSE